MLRRPAAQLSDGLATTFDVLGKTHNESAVDVLICALDHANPQIQEHALAALLARKTLKGHREVIARLPTMNGAAKQLVQSNPRFLGRALRETVESNSPAQCAHGCQTALWLREYDLMPALVHVAESVDHPNRRVAAEHVLKLAELLYEDLANGRPGIGTRDPQLTRQHVLHTLEKSLARYPQHKRTEIVEAFLLLAPRDHSALRKILSDPIDSAYLAMIDILTNSRRGGVIRLVLSFLDDGNAPPAAIALMGHRCDQKFIEHFLRKIGSRSSAEVSANLKRLDTIAWAHANLEILDQVDDEAQQGAVQLALCSSIGRVTAHKLVAHLLRAGKTGGRRAAAAALAGIRGAEANHLALEAVNDPDGQVQASVLAQLRPRGITGALPILLGKLDSPHEIVRAAVRRSLEEFSFDRFLSAFDMLDEQVRRSSGAMVRKVDPHTTQRLIEELQARSRTRRLRGLQMAAALQLVGAIETEIIARLSDEDHLVRVEATTALAQSQSTAARHALKPMLNDRSVVVREAAQRTLNEWKSVPVIDAAFAAALFDSFETESNGDDTKRTKPLPNGPKNAGDPLLSESAMITAIAFSANCSASVALLAARVNLSGAQLALFISLVAAVVALLRLATWWSQERVPRAHRPHKLFQALCKAHQLDQTQQRLLSLMSKSLSLTHPGEIFLRADLFDGDRLGPQFQPYAQQLSQLKALLFGQRSAKKST